MGKALDINSGISPLKTLKLSKPEVFNNLSWFFVVFVIWILNFTLLPSVNAYYVTMIIYAGINIILAVSLNLVNGFTGQFSMGHAGFMAVGGYSSAFISLCFKKYYPQFYDSIMLSNLFFIISLCSGGLLASVAGYLVGLPSLRLRGDYLAIVTLGFGEIIRVFILNIDAIGGARGLPGIPSLSSFAWVFTFALITVFFVKRLISSPMGRELLSVREDEIASEAMGVPTTQAKVRAFVIGSFFAGIAGGLFAHFLCYLNPANFDFNKSFDIIIMVVLGGMGSISGSILAAVILTVLKEGLRSLQELTHLDFRMIIYSLILILMMILRPNGLFGTNEIWNLYPFKKFFKRS